MTFLWTITADHINTFPDKNDIGAGNYRGDKPNTDLPCRFKLYDDDDILYYEGRSNDQISQSAFRPLDWSMGNAGCTRIDYLCNGKWETL